MEFGSDWGGSDWGGKDYDREKKKDIKDDKPKDINDDKQKDIKDDKVKEKVDDKTKDIKNDKYEEVSKRKEFEEKIKEQEEKETREWKEHLEKLKEEAEEKRKLKEEKESQKRKETDERIIEDKKEDRRQEEFNEKNKEKMNDKYKEIEYEKIREDLTKKEIEEGINQKEIQDYKREIFDNLGDFELQNYFKEFSIEKQMPVNKDLEIRTEFREFIEKKDDISDEVKKRLIEKSEKITENHLLEKFLIYALNTEEKPNELISEYEEHTGIEISLKNIEKVARDNNTNIRIIAEPINKKVKEEVIDKHEFIPEVKELLEKNQKLKEKIVELKSEHLDNTLDMKNQLKEIGNIAKETKEPITEIENNKNSIIVREKRIHIEVPELEKIRDELNRNGISLNRLRNEIGMSFEHLYRSRSSSMSEKSFKKLETLLERKIPHEMEFGAIKDCKLELNSQLAELTAIILGDGGLYKPPSSERHVLSITLNGVDEKSYVDHVKNLIHNVFQMYPSESPRKNEKAITLRFYGKGVVNFFESIGIPTGNKVENQIDVPKWIRNNKEFAILGLKGLFDTDGSISVDHSHKSIILTFRNASYPLASDFKEICKLLNIETQPKIMGFHEFKEGTREKNSGYLVKISSKYYVKNFLEIINPEKWNDRNRREYIGTTLILLNSDKKTQEKVIKQIKEVFPKKSDRRYTIKYARFLKKVCIENGCDINDFSIENAIRDSLEYKSPRYNRSDAKRLKEEFEQLGSFKAVREYEISQGNIPRKAEQISKHIRMLFQDSDYVEKYGQNGYKKWYSEIKRNKY